MTRLCLVMLVLALGLGAAGDAGAQSRRRDAPRSSQNADLPPSVPPPVSTLTPVRGIAGPKLERGAVLCGSEQDLQHRAEVNRRVADGNPDAGDPMSGCRLLIQERGVEVVARRGFGRTQVKVKPSGEVAWTDAYLPN